LTPCLEQLNSSGPAKQRRALLESNPQGIAGSKGDEIKIVSAFGEALNLLGCNPSRPFISEPEHALLKLIVPLDEVAIISFGSQATATIFI
jgi:hypothetical protein